MLPKGRNLSIMVTLWPFPLVLHQIKPRHLDKTNPHIVFNFYCAHSFSPFKKKRLWYVVFFFFLKVGTWSRAVVQMASSLTCSSLSLRPRNQLPCSEDATTSWVAALCRPAWRGSTSSTCLSTPERTVCYSCKEISVCWEVSVALGMIWLVNLRIWLVPIDCVVVVGVNPMTCYNRS